MEEKKAFELAVKEAKEVMDAVEYAIQIMESFNTKAMLLQVRVAFAVENSAARAASRKETQPTALDDEYSL